MIRKNSNQTICFGILLMNLFLFCACSSPSSQWQLNSISAGDLIFNSTRLRFISSQIHPPFTFEMMKFSNRIESFVHLNRFRFTENPILVTLKIEGEAFEERVSVYEGAMRLKLSEESTIRLIQALQDGKEVVILVDGFEEKLSPIQFPAYFRKE